MMEKYKDIPGYEGLYQVSNLGNVKSIKFKLHRVLNPGKHSRSKYYCVNLYKDKKRNLKSIHQLVAISFLNHKPNGHKIVVDHIDNNSLNNRVENLQLVTNRENTSKGNRLKKTSSIFTGVSWNKDKKKWSSKIHIDGVLKHLGYFINEVEAYIEYENKRLSL